MMGRLAAEEARQEFLQRAEDVRQRAVRSRDEAARWPELSEWRTHHEREAERLSEWSERLLACARSHGWAVEMNKLHLMEKQIGPIFFTTRREDREGS